MPRDVRLFDIVAGAVTVFQSGGDRKSGPFVPGAFTPAGWEIVKGRIKRLTADREHDENAWVLAAPRKREGVDADALRAAYFRRYVDAWKTFLLSLSVKEPTNIEEVRSAAEGVRHGAAARFDLAQRQQGSDLQGRLAARQGDRQGQGGDRRADQEDAGAGRRRAAEDAAAPAGRGGRPASEDPTTPEDVGREFGSFLSFGLTKPTGLETYGQILAEIAGRRRRIGRARSPRRSRAR